MSYAAMETAPRRMEEAPVRVTWAGNPWSLTGLCFLNLLLVVLTVGIYWFWARSEYRRYMWQMVRVNGEPLEYTGTGRELLIGYLKLFAFVILPVILFFTVMNAVLGPKSPLLPLVILPFYAAFFFLYFAGVFRAHRYILSRTRWRGIAFGLAEGASGYAWASIWTALVNGLTAGWLLPWRTVALRRRIVSAMRFGSAPLRFEGGSGSLYGPFAVAWLAGVTAYIALIAAITIPMIKYQEAHPGRAPAPDMTKINFADIPQTAVLIFIVAIPILIIAMSWFESNKLNIFARATKFGGMSAHLEATGASIFWLTLTNAFLLLISLGILRPVTQARRLRYLVERLSFSGYADINAVQRGADYTGAAGAGLETAFSIEIF